MATSSAANRVFTRELLELRVSSALMAAFENWTTLAVTALMNNAPDVRDEFLRGTVLSAVPDEFREAAAAYFDDYQVLTDALEVLEEVRTYAANQGLGKEATRRLMRAAVTLDKGVFVPIPTETLTRTAVRVPAVVPQPPPYTVPQHPSLLAPNVPLAQTGMSYRNRLLMTARTMATAVSGREARAEAERTGQDLRWVTMGDQRVRETHAAAQGQTVAHDEWFRVGGTPMEYPGDPAAPADETINCRCVLTLVTPPERRYVQSYIPPAWLNAAAAPNQARAPRGTPIGGQWIDTPGGLLGRITPGEAAGAPLSVEIGGSVYTGTPAPEHGREAAIRDHGYSTPTLYHSKGDPESAQAFQNAIQAAKDGNKYGASVYVYDVADYEDMDLWVTADGTAGIALHGNDIVSGFNMGTNPANRGYVQHAMATAQAAGGTRADAFDTVLPDLYAQAGMEVVARVKWDDDYAPEGWDYDTFAAFNGGRPDVVFLQFNPEGWWGTYTPGQGQTVESYEDGQALTASGQRQVDRVVGPAGRARRGDVVVGRTGSQVPAHERDAVLLSPFHAVTLHQQPVGNPCSDYAAPNQARAPRGTPIGGQWIDTPNALLHDLGWAREDAGQDARVFEAPTLTAQDIPARTRTNPQAQRATLNTPANTDITPDQRYAVQEYTGTGFNAMNKTLRGEPLDQYDQHWLSQRPDVIRNMAAAQRPAPNPLVVYRGFGGNLSGTDRLGGDPAEMVGSVVADDAFFSATMDPATAAGSFGGGRGSYMEVIIPAGSPVIWAEPWSINPGELEVILPPRTSLAITGSRLDDLGRTIIEATVVEEAWDWSPEVSELLAAAARPPKPIQAPLPEPLFEVDEGEGEYQHWDHLSAAAPKQARAKKGTPIGGQWIETPGSLLARAQGVGVREDLVLGFSDPEQVAKARAAAVKKARALPKPTKADRAAAAARHGRSKRQGGDDRPGSQRRKKLRQGLLDEFGDGKTCPCLNCGRTLDITTVSMDRIIPGADNGRYVPQNLIPMDYDCNRARSDDAFKDMASTWATNPGSGPVVPLGTVVRARPSGWGADESGDLDGADDAPSLEGVPEWVEGPLEGQPVPGYFKHIVAGVDVDPDTVGASD